MAGSTSRKDEEIPRAPKRKGGQAVTEKEWHQIVVLALRGNTPPAIARMTGFHERTIRRFFTEGFTRAPWGRTPIRRIIEEEQTKARALRERIGEDRSDPTPFEAEEKARVEEALGAASLPEREGAKRDALESRTAEAQLVKLARGNAIGLAGAAVGLLKPARALALEIARVIAERIKTQKIEPDAGLALLRDIARYSKDVIETGHRAMEMERLLLGDPSGGGKLANDAAAMSLDEAMTELGNAAKVFGAMERRGWRVVDGGKGKPASVPGESVSPNGQNTFRPGVDPVTFEPVKQAQDSGQGQTFDARGARTVSTDVSSSATTEADSGDVNAAGAAAEPATEDPTP